MSRVIDHACDDLKCEEVLSLCNFVIWRTKGQGFQVLEGFESGLLAAAFVNSRDRRLESEFDAGRCGSWM